MAFKPEQSHNDDSAVPLLREACLPGDCTRRSPRLRARLPRPVTMELEGIAVLYLVFAGYPQSEALEICGRLRAAHLRNGLLPVLREIPQQRANHRLAQPVTRAARPSGKVS